MDKEKLLKEIGLTEKEAKTYLAILESGFSTIKPIALRADLKRTSVYNFIDHLVELGLITQAEHNGRMHYKANPPEKLVEIQKAKTKLLQESLPQFLSIYNDQTTKPKISYFEGAEQIRNIGKEVLECKHEVCYLWGGPELTQITGGDSFWNKINDDRVKKGISVRLIRFSGHEKLYEKSTAGKEFLRQTRWAPKDLEKMVDHGLAIYDTGKIGVFGSRDEGYGILIESISLFRTLKMMFELVWEKSTPAKPGEG